MELSTIASVRASFYRLCGITASDDALTENGETEGDVAYIYLTRGIRAAQLWLIGQGMGHRWRKRSSALSWSGNETTDGGRYAALPADFLRLHGWRDAGGRWTGAVIEADGEAWGAEIPAEEARLRGNYYYLKNGQLWVARNASPPATAYLDYHYKHPALSAATASFDFPVDAMHLAVAEAASAAKEESWLPAGQEMEQKIERALLKAQAGAKEIARQSRGRPRMRAPRIYGARW